MAKELVVKGTVIFLIVGVTTFFANVWTRGQDSGAVKRQVELNTDTTKKLSVCVEENRKEVSRQDAALQVYKSEAAERQRMIEKLQQQVDRNQQAIQQGIEVGNERYIELLKEIRRNTN